MLPGRSTEELIAQLLTIRDDMLRTVTLRKSIIDSVHGDQRESASNLMHYVALRRHDIRQLQDDLTRRGLSSLGRSESHAVSNVDAVIDALLLMSPQFSPLRPAVEEAPDYARGTALLDRNTTRLFGERPAGRSAYIMVTLPGEAADAPVLVRDLLDAGMNIARINCAHDDAHVWSRMVQHIRNASQETGRQCRILMDLSGPKLRTGRIGAPDPVLKWRPKRDSLGRTISPARIWLTDGAGADPPVPADAVLPVEAEWYSDMRRGGEITLKDARGRKRVLKIVDCTESGCWANCDRTGYVTGGLKLRFHEPAKGGSEGKPGKGKRGFVGELAPEEGYLTLYQGDRLLVTDSQQLGAAATYDDRGRLVSPARIGCTLPEIFADVKKGERILFDDGSIGGVIEEVNQGHLVVLITNARPGGEKLRADKGINLPDSALTLDALTEKDRSDLAFIAREADLIGYSFVRKPGDIEQLHNELRSLGREDIGIVLKVENRQAFENLPSLLLHAMKFRSMGVMIARGDLAVELGYQRLAEVQEEILWVSEAAHAPVVWATQVLENLAKVGVPTRAEVTDAAMGVRTECVMLNKGPFIVQTVRTLGDILSRMEGHQSKKRATLRRLQLANTLPDTSDVVDL